MTKTKAMIETLNNFKIKVDENGKELTEPEYIKQALESIDEFGATHLSQERFIIFNQYQNA